MYGNNYNYYNPARNIGVPTQPINNQFIQQPTQMYHQAMQQPIVGTQIMNNLQGKIVESAEVVKVTEIPLDGSTSYFPLADSSAIITKKLGTNGISEMIVYKPVIEEQNEESKMKNIYLTTEDFNEKIKRLDNKDILDTLSNEIKELTKEIIELKDVKKTKEK